MRKLLSAFILISLGSISLSHATDTDAPIKQHGIAMYGKLKYPSNFTQLDYVNPKAPKGGTVRYAANGTFDNLNNFILKGNPAQGLGQIYDSLTTRSMDEAFSEYGLLAESLETPKDRSWVIFNLRPEARFSDGHAVTAEDVVFTVDILRTKGHPFYRSYYKNIKAVTALTTHRVKFDFGAKDNRELPLIVGQIPILPKHYWATHDFAKTTLNPPLGSGPYLIDTVKPGRSISYRRNPNYWAADLPINRGLYNFNTIQYEYYRDGTIALEAFKGGNLDIRIENVSKNWARAYDIPAVNDGRIHKVNIPNQQSQGMQGFVFNTRQTRFKDPQVREALGYAFDFEWTNQKLFYGAYTRTQSYFSNTELAARGLPSAEELALLEPFREQLPAQIFSQAYTAPSTQGPRGLRKNLRHATRLLKQAGWGIKNGKLTHASTGEVMQFQILLISPAFKRIVLPFVANLKRLGIIADVRLVDASQYQKRLEEFDFDMVIATFGQSLSPGNEQRDFWSSQSAKISGSRNIIGIQNPVVDALIDHVITATDRKALITATRALDRVLQWNHYVIPQWHLSSYRVAYWNPITRPSTNPPYGLATSSWWATPSQ